MTTIQQCSKALERKGDYTRCPNNAKHRSLEKIYIRHRRYSVIIYLCDEHYKEIM